MLRDASQRPRSHYIFNLRCNYLWIIQVAIWNLIKHRVLRRIRIVDVSLSLHPLHCVPAAHLYARAHNYVVCFEKNEEANCMNAWKNCISIQIRL